MANISHEFKTPLTAIRGFSETLLEGALEDSGNRQRFIEIIHDHALRLSRLTDDLLRLAQIEAGQLHLESEMTSEFCFELGAESLPLQRTPDSTYVQYHSRQLSCLQSR